MIRKTIIELIKHNEIKNKMIEFEWKPITEIPTEHYSKNYSISPEYLVKCEGKTGDGLSIIGYSRYSFVTNSWMDCIYSVIPGVQKVIAWTDIKL